MQNKESNDKIYKNAKKAIHIFGTKRDNELLSEIENNDTEKEK